MRIEANGVPCEIKGKRSHQVLMLLEFMIAHRFSKTADQQLADILWGNQDEDKEIKNPTGALKNLVWRCRKLLWESLPPEYADDLILLSGNTYQFNNTYLCTVDIEELDRLYATLRTTSPTSAERRGLLEKAVELYRGVLLFGFMDASQFN